VFLRLEGLEMRPETPRTRKTGRYKMLQRASEFNKSFVKTEEMENRLDIWELNCKESVYVNNIEENCSELAMYFSDVVGVQNVRRDKGKTTFFSKRFGIKTINYVQDDL
jgi:hypothetical protein